MDRIAPEAVVEAVKDLGGVAGRVGWCSKISGPSLTKVTDCYCGAGAVLAKKLGGYKNLAKGFSSNERKVGTFTWVAMQLNLTEKYIRDYTLGFDGVAVEPSNRTPGYLDGVAAVEALKKEGLMYMEPFTEEDDYDGD